MANRMRFARIPLWGQSSGSPSRHLVSDQQAQPSVTRKGIYGKIYFPTFSNSIKEVARYLGFEWNWPHASGAAATSLRRACELGADDGLKRELIGYNMTIAEQPRRLRRPWCASVAAAHPASMQS